MFPHWMPGVTTISGAHLVFTSIKGQICGNWDPWGGSASGHQAVGGITEVTAGQCWQQVRHTAEEKWGPAGASEGTCASSVTKLNHEDTTQPNIRELSCPWIPKSGQRQLMSVLGPWRPESRLEQSRKITTEVRTREQSKNSPMFDSSKISRYLAHLDGDWHVFLFPPFSEWAL